MITFITGGARSGKSKYAQELACSLSEHPVYLATARKWDENFMDRIKRHQADRDERWINIEEEKHVSNVNLEGKVAVIDCVTLWLTNLFMDSGNDIDESLRLFKHEIDHLTNTNATIILISNELGMGVHAETEVGRKFTDLQGWANQYAAQKADKVIFMVSGIPMTLKESSLPPNQTKNNLE